MNKRIVSIATALLIAFSLMPATAQTGTGYDPRADYNGDGVLDIKDVHELVLAADRRGRLAALVRAMREERP